MQALFDQSWRRKALAGDADAVRLLAESALEPLYAFCLYRVGRNHHLCEEAVQEALLRALRELDNYDPARSGKNIFPWLTGLARNEIQRVLAGRASAVSLERLWNRMDRELLDLYARLESEPFGAELLEREETRTLVNAALSQLPGRYREALEAKYFAGDSVRALAERWHVSEKAAESQLTRARQAFRAAFLALAGNLEPGVL